MKVAILGFDREGRSALRFLRRHPRYRNAEFWVLDRNPGVAKDVPRGVRAQLGNDYLRDLERFGLVSRTPGIWYLRPELIRARKAGTTFTSATKLFFDEVGKRTRHVVGVTGTKGKTTTAFLIAQMLKRKYRTVFLAGNIGSPMLDILPRLTKDSRVVLELSSFQLQDLEQSPHIAVVTDIFPDHQDAHRSLREYYAAKANIAAHQHRGDRVFFFADQPIGRRIAGKNKGHRHPVIVETFARFRPEELRTRGTHGFKNAAMAATVAEALGVPRSACRAVALGFKGYPHRLELVRTLMVRQAHHRNRSKIYFYNDSASTNPQTSAAAVQAFAGTPHILLAGGQDKNLSYAPLARALRESPDTKLVVLYGENKGKIRKAIGGRQATGDRRQEQLIVMVRDIETALRRAYILAKTLVASGHPSSPAIILSPGAASFDQFKNYADRGEQFRKMVHMLK